MHVCSIILFQDSFLWINIIKMIMNSHFYLCNCRAFNNWDLLLPFSVVQVSGFQKNDGARKHYVYTGMGQILECKNTIWYITTTTTTSCHHRLLLHQHEIKGDDHYYVYVVAMVLRHLIELPCWGLDWYCLVPLGFRTFQAWWKKRPLDRVGSMLSTVP